MSQSTATTHGPRRTWPVLLLTLPAFAAIWGGWVGLGEKTGFGVINLLPGMVKDGSWSTLNTAITLPIGLETYAAFALHTFMNAVRHGTLRRFAGWSALASLLLGGGGQIAYHAMESMGWERAPLWVTAIVSALPVLVLGLGTILASLIRREASGQEDTSPRVSLAQRVASARQSVQAVAAAAKGEAPEAGKGPAVLALVQEAPANVVPVATIAETIPAIMAEIPVSPAAPKAPTMDDPTPVSPARGYAARNAWDHVKAVQLILEGDRSNAEIGELVGINFKMIQRTRRAVDLLRQDPNATPDPAWKVPARVIEVIRREIRSHS
jgi:hypothetical protein